MESKTIRRFGLVFVLALIGALACSGSIERRGDSSRSAELTQLRVDESEALGGEPKVALESRSGERLPSTPSAGDPHPRARREQAQALRESDSLAASRGDAQRPQAELRGLGHARFSGLADSATGHVLPPRWPAPPAPFHTEQYDVVDEEGFVAVATRPLSTFSIDVDTASYSNLRRFLQEGQLPPEGAVRIEELINYFRYDYPDERGEHPFSVTTEVATAPWNPDNRLVLIGLQAERMALSKVPPRNLVFLLDVSGSMTPDNKLPLVKSALTEMTEELRPQDHVAIVVYAGSSGTVLEPTSGREKDCIVAALDRLQAGGSTNGADGIRLAYDLARRHFDSEGINRVILATDGDFNVGTTSRSELVELIEKERESGVFLTVLGVGMGNLKDATMEQLADRGNGNYAYLDSHAEARKVLIEEASGTLITVAKDVKIQVEFNPAQVRAYRLIGYENRRLRAEDFNDDRKDAGEIGAGHSVTALYELVSADADFVPDTDPLRYQRPSDLTRAADSSELVTVSLRYKRPDGDRSKLLRVAVSGKARRIEKASENLRFAAAVAAFGMVLGDSEERGEASLDMAQSLARDALGTDRNGYRAEFVRLVAMARGIRRDG